MVECHNNTTSHSVVRHVIKGSDMGICREIEETISHFFPEDKVIEGGNVDRKSINLDEMKMFGNCWMSNVAFQVKEARNK